ncbi:hypothetical protein ACFTE1_11550 [Salininema proteolyticum]|uniref:hypothetical protein n=1 Tax=Salininema proteolyticum TaxID=1607685 RepID=UPI0036434E19
MVEPRFGKRPGKEGGRVDSASTMEAVSGFDHVAGMDPAERSGRHDGGPSINRPGPENEGLFVLRSFCARDRLAADGQECRWTM